VKAKIKVIRGFSYYGIRHDDNLGLIDKRFSARKGQSFIGEASSVCQGQIGHIDKFTFRDKNGLNTMTNIPRDDVELFVPFNTALLAVCHAQAVIFKDNHGIQDKFVVFPDLIENGFKLSYVFGNHRNVFEITENANEWVKIYNCDMFVVDQMGLTIEMRTLSPVDHESSLR
jgi:hypothetical protein